MTYLWLTLLPCDTRVSPKEQRKVVISVWLCSSLWLRAAHITQPLSGTETSTPGDEHCMAGEMFGCLVVLSGRPSDCCMVDMSG